MGQLLDGTWHDGPVTAGADAAGRFVRQQTLFRQWVSRNGSTPFAPEPGRYHLYLARACPWCHRTDITLSLKGLRDVISTSYVHPLMAEGGWRFDDDGYADPLHGAAYVHELYQRANPSHTGRVTVPLLWDRHTDRPVSNESSEIIRMFDGAFDEYAAADAPTLAPAEHLDAIDAWNARTYESVNNGVYKCGFAQTQAAYEEAFTELFRTLDAIDAHLDGRDWLLGDRPTEADVRLWPTLIRFDAVYVTHFKCNLRRIQDYPRLQAYTRRFYALDGVADTVRIDEIKTHYFASHRSLNPTGIVPVGPKLWLD